MGSICVRSKGITPLGVSSSVAHGSHEQMNDVSECYIMILMIYVFQEHRGRTLKI